MTVLGTIFYVRNKLVGQRQPSCSGFTVVEILVVMGLLLVVVATTADIFSSLSRSERRVYANQRVQSDLRLALETMAREVHQGTIDYDYYDAITAPAQPVLALRNASGQAVKFTLTNGAIQISRGSVTSWNAITSPALTVHTLGFYLSPLTNPFAPCSRDCSTVPNIQPHVTVNLSAQAVTGPSDQISAVFVQTTLTTRAYQR